MTLAELEHLAKAATPGLWSLEYAANNVHVNRIKSGSNTVADMRFKNGCQDAAYIAAACNMVQPMIEAIRMAEDALEYLVGLGGNDCLNPAREALAAIRQLDMETTDDK